MKNISGLVFRIQRFLARRIVFARNIEMKNTVLLASMGRSGSTYVSSLINHDGQFRVLFEPFREELIPQAASFPDPTYLPRGLKSDKLKEDAIPLLKGDFYSPWVNWENRKIFQFCKYRLVKEIRVNFYLAWLKNNFPDLQVLLLIRHPLAVYQSWKENNFGDTYLGRDKLLENEYFINDIKPFLTEKYAKAEDALDVFIFSWCFHYYIPLMQLEKSQYKLIFYENIVLDPDNQLFEIFSFLGMNPDVETARSIANLPSSTTNKADSYFMNKENVIASWQKDFSQAELNRAYEILEYFGLDGLYNKETGLPENEFSQSISDQLK